MKLFKKAFSVKYLLAFLLVLPLFLSAETEKKSNSNINLTDRQIEQKIGQLLFMDFRNWGKDENDKYQPVTEPNKTISGLIEKYNFGGIALFKENTVNPAQTIKLVKSYQDSAKTPLIISVDQEGGLVTRLQTGTRMPGNMLLGATGNTSLTEKVSQIIGKELHCQGINMNFAPCVDVNSNPENPVIGIRSFGCKPELVSAMANAYIKGLNNESVLACVKHFPGHGNTATDTHVGLALVDYSLEDWEKTDMPPFKSAIDNGVSAIMTAHVIVPALDDSKQKSILDSKLVGTPATLSYKILTGMLRGKLNFKGLIITDAMDMKAIADNFGTEDAVIKTILAGADMPLMPVRVWDEDGIQKLNSLMNKLVQVYKTDSTFRERVNESYNRIAKIKNEKKFQNSLLNLDNLNSAIKKAEEIVGCEDNKKIECETSAAGITLLKNNGILPYQMKADNNILVIDNKEIRLKIVKDQIETLAKVNDIHVNVKTIKTNEDSILDENLEQNIKSSNLIIMLTYNLKKEDKFPESVAKFAKENGIKSVSISCRNPYDIRFTPTIDANLCIYGAVSYDQTNSTQSLLTINLINGINSIFMNNSTGKAFNNPKGKLPVDIPAVNTDKILYHYGFGLSYK